MYRVYLAFISILIGLAFFLTMCGRKEGTQTDSVIPTPLIISQQQGQMSLSDIREDNLDTLLRQMTGYDSVTIEGSSIYLKERYTPAGKDIYRKFWAN